MSKDNSKTAIWLFLLFSLCFLSTLCLSSMLWLEQKFGNTNIETILFHYQHSLVGTPVKYYVSYAKRLAVSLSISLAFTGIIYYTAVRTAKASFLRLTNSFLLVLLFFSIGLTIVRLDVTSYILGSFKKNTFIEDNYIAVGETALFPENKRNVIILVLESMEKTFSNTNMFEPPLTPYLHKLTQNNPSCTLWVEKNMTWTTAGLTALFMGVPLYVPINNSYNPDDASFLPGAESILKIFDDNGYSTTYIAGSDVRFASINNIFTTHVRSPKIYEKLFFMGEGISLDWRWGIKDFDLYRRAKEIISDTAVQDEPFLIVLQTIDTHNTAKAFGHHPEPYGDSRDAFVAADFMVEDFIYWLSKQPFYKNTTVLIVGDHLYMDSNLGSVDLGERFEQHRSIYNVLLNAVNIENSAIAQREALMVDMGPSLLEAIGVTLPNQGLALGRSVFNHATPTLVEHYGRKQLTENLSGFSEFYNMLFFHPEKQSASDSLTATTSEVHFMQGETQ